jgi:RNA polymerase primary sigma factor
MNQNTARKAKPSRKTRIGVVVKRKNARNNRGDEADATIIAPANDTGFSKETELDLEDLGTDSATLALPEDASEDGAIVPVASASAEAENDGEDEVALADEEVEADAEEEEAEEAAPAASRRARADDEPVSFLGMYFRDMAELDVLRPEQEFETARQIESMEIELWKTILGFAPGATWMADTIDRAVGEPVPELKAFRSFADRSRKKASIQARARFSKEIGQIAVKLRGMDIDRVFLDASVGEIARVGRVLQGLPYEGQVSFSTASKAFRDYVRSVAGQAVRLKMAKNEFVKANLRLVVSIARRFNHGRLPLPDLIQEGNIGLMKAVERYDYRRGFRFSTYASWWIRHAISRALADKGRAVRLPVHMIDAYHRIGKSQRELQSKLERPPTTEEVASATGIEVEKLEKMKTFLAETPVSLDRPISDEDGRRLIDVLVDPDAADAVPDQMASSETQTEMLKLLGDLRPIEADILRKRFGLETDRERTLKEIGDEYRLSRERVRQLQEQALGKMRRAMAKREMA